LLIGAEVPDARRAAPHRQSAAQERRALRKFVRRIIAFAVPIVVVLATVELLWWRVGETWPLERVIRRQALNTGLIFCRAIFDQGTFRYKYLQVLRRKPGILVVGSSRAMQFRSEMFGRQSSLFYNAGGIVHSLTDLSGFIDYLPAEATPKTMILAVDFWWLNEDDKGDVASTFSRRVDEDGAYRWQGHALGISTYLRDWHQFRQLVRCSIGKRYNPDAIGLQAAMVGGGFRIDGSRRFVTKIPTTPEGWNHRRPREAVVANRIRYGGRRFEFTPGISRPREELLSQILVKLKDRGVFVVAYSPPLITECARLMASHPRQKQFWNQYHTELPTLFRALNIPYIDMSTPADVGLDDRYMLDPLHPHETFDLYLLQRLCLIPEVRAAFPDVPQIARKVLASPRTNPLFPDLAGGEKLTSQESANSDED